MKNYDIPQSRNAPWIISNHSQESIGPILNNFAGGSIGSGTNAVWPLANWAIFMPFYVAEPFTVRRISVVNGNVVNGNTDVGIYRNNGARMVSAGGVAMAGASQEQLFDVTDTFLVTGVYYMAMVHDDIVGSFNRIAPAALEHLTITGVAEMLNAYPLPDPAVMVTLTQNYSPFMALLSHTL